MNNRQAAAAKTYNNLMNIIGDDDDNRAIVADAIRAERGDINGAAVLVANEFGMWVMQELDPYWNANC